MNNMDFEELGLLVEQAQNDRDAFGRLVVQFNATVFAIVLRRLGDWDDAQELVQEIWLHVMSRIHQIRQPKRFAGWLEKIAVRMAINRATRSRPLIQAEDGWLESIAGRSRHGTVLDEVVERERDESVREAVAELDEIDREALVRHEWGGQSLLEMALALDVPLGTVKRRRNSARKRLRLKLVNRAKRDRAYCRAIQGS